MYTANIHITLKDSILDPKGKASKNALANLGLTEITEARIGKYIQLSIDASSEEKAYKIADQACEKLLANEVIENYSIKIEAIESVT